VEEEIDLREYIEVILRRWKWIGGITLVAVVTAAIVSFFVIAPVYEAKAGGRAVDWKGVQRRYEQQVKPCLPSQPWWHVALSRFGQALRWLVRSPAYLGRLLLLTVKRPTTDETNNLVVGYVILIAALVVIGLVAQGIITRDVVVNLLQWWKWLQGGK